LLGHKDLRMAARYQHLSPAFLADAVARLDGVFGSLPAGSQGKDLPPFELATRRDYNNESSGS
jgi:hypothetical protein